MRGWGHSREREYIRLFGNVGNVFLSCPQSCLRVSVALFSAGENGCEIIDSRSASGSGQSSRVASRVEPNEQCHRIRRQDSDDDEWQEGDA